MIIYIILYADMQKNNMDTFYEYEIIIICRKYIKIHVYDIYMYDTIMYNIEIQFTVPGLVRSRKQDLLKGPGRAVPPESETTKDRTDPRFFVLGTVAKGF